MNYSRKNTISQQKNDGQSYSLGITQSSGLGLHTVFLQAVSAERSAYILIIRPEERPAVLHQLDQGAAALFAVLLPPLDRFCLLVFDGLPAPRAEAPLVVMLVGGRQGPAAG